MSTKTLASIGEQLRRIIGPITQQIISGVVKGEVNEETGTCSVALSVDGDVVTDGVLVTAVMNNHNGLMLIPAVNSQVWVATIDSPDKMGIVKYSNIDKMIARVGANWTELVMTNESITATIGNSDTELSMTADAVDVRMGGSGEVKVSVGSGTPELSVKDGKIVMNGGDNGGATITPTLKTELDKVKNLLTHVVSIINGAPIPEPGSGAASALQTALATAIATDTLPSFEAIENENVKH